MSAIFGETVTLGQANGPDVQLVVWGDEWYATYETPSGYPAIYDAQLGLFCYARLVNGRFESTGVPVAQGPPPGVEQHARESDAVKLAKIAEAKGRRSHASSQPKQNEEEP